MMHKGKRNLFLVVALVLLAVLLGGVYSSWDFLWESWWLRALRSGGAPERATAVRRLGKAGAERAARAIVSGLVDQAKMGDSALLALDEILPRLKPSLRAWIVDRLLQVVVSHHASGEETQRRIMQSLVRRGAGWTSYAPAVRGLMPPLIPPSNINSTPVAVDGREESLSQPLLVKVIADASASTPEVFPVLIARAGKGYSERVAVLILAAQWPASRLSVESFLGTAPAVRVESFLEALADLFILDAGSAAGGGQLKAEVHERARQSALSILRSLVQGHARPEVRALALSKVIVEPQEGPGFRYAPEVLGRAFREDPDPGVRRAAVRLSGCLGDRPEALDLKKLLLEETDPVLLTEVVQARTLWAHWQSPEWLEVEGGLFSHLRVGLEGLEPAKLRPLLVEEIARLEGLLLQNRQAALRDAASLALAARFRSREDGSTPPPAEPADFEVHEWAVLADRGSTLAPAERSIADLPDFVHRSVTPMEGLVGQATPDAFTGLSMKPVIFFHGGQPASFLVRVWFLGGRPWVFYPEPTDYVEARSEPRREGDDFLAELGLRDESMPVEAPAQDPGATPQPLDAPGLSPPWILEEAARNAPQTRGPADPSRPRASTFPAEGSPRPPEGEMRSRYELVPWIFPASHPRDEDGSDLRGLGLEWCGLRVGYGPEVEEDLARVNGNAGKGLWWERLRRVPASPVALRGNHERFLFYEGSVRLPSPVTVRWADASRKALQLRTRDFLALPRLEDWQSLNRRSQGERAPESLPATSHFPGAFVIRKESGGKAAGRFLPNLGSRCDPLTVPLTGLDLSEDALREKMDALLAAEGLTREESRSLLETWDEELFALQGLRVVTVLPRWLYDAIQPIEIQPPPRKLVRVALLLKDCSSLETGEPTGEAQKISFGAAEPLGIAESRLEVRRTALEPQPAEPFEIDPDGKLVQISPGSHTMLLSGDGKRIAHPRDGLRGLEIYLGDLEKKTFTVLARFSTTTYLEDYSLSADGNRVGMLMRERDVGRVFTADFEKRQLLEVLGPWKRLTWSYLSRDGRFLSFLHEGKPMVVDLETGAALALQIPARGKAYFPVLSPEGSKVVLILSTKEARSLPKQAGQAGEEEDSGPDRQEVVLMDLSARTLRRIARLPGGGPFPDLSADGRRVLFGSHDVNRVSSLFLADLETSRLLRIAPHEVNAHLHNITDDGTRVLFVHGNAVWVIDLATGTPHTAWAAPPGTMIQMASASRDGRRVLLKVVESATHRNVELRLLDLPER